MSGPRRHRTSTLTVVMYHYVRDLARSRYPKIKGLTIEHFQEQLDYLQRHYRVVSPEEVIAALRGNGDGLPPEAVLLTFDDGYIDHFTNVFPILLDRGLPGVFFPPAKTVTEHRILDVNKIHFILAAVPDKGRIVERIFEMIDAAREDFRLEPNKQYYSVYARPNRFDPAEVIFIKSILQKGLPEPLRDRMADALFAEFVSEDETTFACDLYMSLDQLRAMAGAGMHIGSHGNGHYWMDTLTPEEQETEIDASLAFLGQVGAPAHEWTFCYPYGAYDEHLVKLLRAKGCALGFTTRVDIADLNHDDPLTLPRLDTNDLPKERAAPPNRWARKVVAAGADRVPS